MTAPRVAVIIERRPLAMSTTAINRSSAAFYFSHPARSMTEILMLYVNAIDDDIFVALSYTTAQYTRFLK